MGNFLLSAFSCSSQLSIQDLFVNTLKVVLGRRLLGVFMTVYMPTILMNIVGHSTIYFRPFLFEAQVKTRMTMLLNQISGVCQSDSDVGPHNNVCQVHYSKNCVIYLRQKCQNVYDYKSHRELQNKYFVKEENFSCCLLSV